MGANKTDIQQIRKYLEGELDAHAMHQMEREAQDDPFLMDAMEGFETAGTSQQINLNDLDQRLQERIGGAKVRRMIPWKYYAAAASVLIVFTLGYLLWPGAGKEVAPQKTASVVTPAPADHRANTTDTVTSPAAQQNEVAASKPVQPAISSDNNTAYNKATGVKSENEARVDEPAANTDTKVVTDDKAAGAAYGYTPPARQQFSNSAVPVPPGALARQAFKKSEAVNDTSRFTGKASAGVFRTDTTRYNAVVYKSQRRDSAVLNEISIRGKASTLTEKDVKKGNALAVQTLPGKIDGVQVTTPESLSLRVMSEMGMPLVNTRIDIEGMKPGTQMQIQTDAYGRVTVPVNGQTALNVISPGYESAQVKTTGAGELKVALKPADQFLSDPEITGYGKTKAVKTIKQAHPLMGWESYYKYLNTQAISSDGAGNVELSFTVDAKGQRGGFVIIKGLTEKLNQRAIDLVKNGPNWAPDVSGETKTVKIRVHFSGN